MQNTLGIQKFYDLPAEIVAGQIEAIVNDVQPAVIKIGLLRSVAVIDVIVDVLQRYKPRYVVYDPIFVSSKGEKLVGDNVVNEIRRRLLPLCTIVVEQRMAHHGQNNAVNFKLRLDAARNLIDGFEQRHHAFQGKMLCLHGNQHPVSCHERSHRKDAQ